jgi:NDP-sugar pyrophosphorylase family protein
MRKDVALVPMVAGISSRFGGKIKQLVKVGPNNETLIEYSLGQALKTDFDKIVFVVGDKTEKGFKKIFGNEYMGRPVYYAKQSFDSKIRDRPWGTIDAVCAAEEYLDSPFVLCNGDDITGENSFRMLYDHLQKSENSATVGIKLGGFLSNEAGVNRGIFELDENNYVKTFKEYFNIERDNLYEMGLTENSLCNFNLFGLHMRDLDLFKMKTGAFKERYCDDRTVECLLPDEIGNLVREGKMNMKFFYSFEGWMGVTNPRDEDVIRKAIQS